MIGGSDTCRPWWRSNYIKCINDAWTCSLLAVPNALPTPQQTVWQGRSQKVWVKGRDAEGVEGVRLGGSVLLPMRVGPGEGAMPSPRKFLQFHSCIDYILEHFNAFWTDFFLYDRGSPWAAVVPGSCQASHMLRPHRDHLSVRPCTSSCSYALAMESYITALYTALLYRSPCTGGQCWHMLRKSG